MCKAVFTIKNQPEPLNMDTIWCLWYILTCWCVNSRMYVMWMVKLSYTSKMKYRYPIKIHELSRLKPMNHVLNGQPGHGS